MEPANERLVEKRWKAPHSRRSASYKRPSKLAKPLECGVFHRFRSKALQGSQLAVRWHHAARFGALILLTSSPAAFRTGPCPSSWNLRPPPACGKALQTRITVQFAACPTLLLPANPPYENISFCYRTGTCSFQERGFKLRKTVLGCCHDLSALFVRAAVTLRPLARQVGGWPQRSWF